MSDENSNPTIDSESNARLDLFLEQFEALKNGLSAVQNTLVNFPGMVVAALSGEAQPTITTTAAPRPVARQPRDVTGRRGRPIDPNSARQIAMRAKAEKKENRRSAQQAEMHMLQRSILEIVTKEKRVTQSDLADRLNIPRSQVRHHAINLVSHGKIRAEIVKPKGGREEVLYRAASAVKIMGE